MPTLKAPNQVFFFASLILAIGAWITLLARIPYVGDHPSILLTLAYLILIICVIRYAEQQPVGNHSF